MELIVSNAYCRLVNNSSVEILVRRALLTTYLTLHAPREQVPCRLIVPFYSTGPESRPFDDQEVAALPYHVVVFKQHAYKHLLPNSHFFRVGSQTLAVVL